MPRKSKSDKPPLINIDNLGDALAAPVIIGQEPPPVAHPEPLTVSPADPIAKAHAELDALTAKKQEIANRLATESLDKDDLATLKLALATYDNLEKSLVARIKTFNKGDLAGRALGVLVIRIEALGDVEAEGDV